MVENLRPNGRIRLASIPSIIRKNFTLYTFYDIKSLDRTAVKSHLLYNFCWLYIVKYAIFSYTKLKTKLHLAVANTLPNSFY